MTQLTRDTGFNAATFLSVSVAIAWLVSPGPAACSGLRRAFAAAPCRSQVPRRRMARGRFARVAAPLMSNGRHHEPR